ncbi:MAG: hypothetical protein ACI4M6_06980 [Christensenellaceae bacterium]
MLDKRTEHLLNIINRKCDKGSFKIVSLDEILLAFPASYGADKQLIRQMTDALKASGYVSIMYDGDDEICIAPTPKGREHFEFECNVSNAASTQKKSFKDYLYNFLTVFFANLATLILFFLARWLYAVS